MANRVTFSNPALADLQTIAEHIGLDSPSAARRWVQDIRARCAGLAELPDVGVEVRRGLRRIVAGNYLIFYRTRSDRVQIARIFHGARQIPPTLGG